MNHSNLNGKLWANNEMIVPESISLPVAGIVEEEVGPTCCKAHYKPCVLIIRRQFDQ